MSRPLIFYSGRFVAPWAADVPLRVVAARLAAELRPSFPRRVSSTGDAVHVRMVSALYFGAPVTGEIRLDHDGMTPAARYTIGVERPGLLALVLGLALGAVVWALAAGALGWAQALVPVVLVPVWLWSVHSGLERWVEPFESAFREATPPS